MIDIVDHIEQALERGCSKYRIEFVIKLLTTGNLSVFVADHMSASVRLHKGQAQIVHVAGDWNKADVKWLRIRLYRQMVKWNVTSVRYEGRDGWGRFLQMKGITL